MLFYLMPSKIRQIAPSLEADTDSVCDSFPNYLSTCLHIILRRLPSLLSHQMRQKIRVHREVLRISVANILPYECHVVSALNYGCACINIKELFTSKYFLWQRTKLFKKRFKVALGCMAIRTQTELMIRRVQFIRRTKEAATQAACAGNSRGYQSEYGYSWFNNRENDDAYYMFRSYNNCYYSSSEPVNDEEDEL